MVCVFFTCFKFILFLIYFYNPNLTLSSLQHLLNLSASVKNLVKLDASQAEEIDHKVLVVPLDTRQGCPLEAEGGSSRESLTCTEER